MQKDYKEDVERGQECNRRIWESNTRSATHFSYYNPLWKYELILAILFAVALIISIFALVSGGTMGLRGLE